jgi:LysR family glycine cleavage system transcriptional activator
VRNEFSTSGPDTWKIGEPSMTRRLPSLSALAAFEAFARHGRMTRAADELCVTHGAVSRQIKALETQLGVRLITGHRTALTLTPAGLTLAQGLTAGFTTIRAALPPGANAKQGRPVRLSCNGTFAMRWLIPRLQTFLADHKDVQVEISESHAPVDFTTGDYDAAIRLTLAGAAAGQIVTDIMPHHFGPVAAPGAGPVLTLPRLHSRTHPPAWAEWAESAGAELPEVGVEREFDHIFYMLEAAASGLGAAIGSWPLVFRDIEQGRMVAPHGFVPGQGRIAFFAPRRDVHPGLEPLKNWLLTEAAAMPDPPGPL